MKRWLTLANLMPSRWLLTSKTTIGLSIQTLMKTEQVLTLRMRKKANLIRKSTGILLKERTLTTRTQDLTLKAGTTFI